MIRRYLQAGGTRQPHRFSPVFRGPTLLRALRFFAAIHPAPYFVCPFRQCHGLAGCGGVRREYNILRSSMLCRRLRVENAKRKLKPESRHAEDRSRYEKCSTLEEVGCWAPAGAPALIRVDLRPFAVAPIILPLHDFAIPFTSITIHPGFCQEPVNNFFHFFRMDLR